MFKKAIKIDLKVPTVKGMLNLHQLFHCLTLPELADSVRAAKEVITTNDDDELSFLDENKKVDEIAVMRFEILKEVYLDKKGEMDANRKAAEKKARGEELLRLIKKKQGEDMEGLPLEELEKLYEENNK